MPTGAFVMSRSRVRLWPFVSILVVAGVLCWSSARAFAEGSRQDASSGSGSQVAPAPADAGADAGQVDQLDALFDEGQGVYGTNCFECHMPGGAGPKLDGDTVLASKDKVVTQIIKGSANGNMPPFGSLTDRQVAAVATFVRNDGSNTYGVVLEADVARVREALKAAAGK
jgi:mono/diheme cytochrome c family protein